MFVGMRASLGGMFDGGGKGKVEVGVALGERWSLVGLGCVCQVVDTAFGALGVGFCCCGAYILGPSDVVVEE